MMIFGNLPVNVQGAFGICTLPLLAGALFLLVTICCTHMKHSYTAAAVLVLCAVMFMLQGFCDNCVPYEVPETYTFFSAVICRIPWVAVSLILCGIAAAEIMLLIKIGKAKKQIISPDAFRESLNAMDDGVCFYDKSGQPLMVNERMNRISSMLIGSEILNGESFWNCLYAGTISEDSAVIQREPVMMLMTADGSVWNFRKNELKTGKCTVFEIIAYDVTAQYHLNQLLDEKIKRLAAVNERLREYGTQVDKVIREKEILSAKIKVHNEAGRTLLAFRSYLEQPKHERNREKLLSLWRYNLAVMRNDTEPKQQSNDWELLLDAAEAVDVEIALNGELPEKGTVRKAIISAIHECLTNTVKHAGGTRLEVSIVADNTVAVSITNDGTAPSGEIQETGGLLNLRSTVEAAGGSMMIQSRPHFMLQLEFMKEEVK